MLSNRPSSGRLTAEAVQGAALALEGVDNVESSHGLAAGVLSVCDGIADDVLEEHLEHTPGLLVDEAGDTFHTTTASQTPDGGLCDTCKAEGSLLLANNEVEAGVEQPQHLARVHQQVASFLHCIATKQSRKKAALTLDVITQDLAMTLGATLAKALASLSTSRHACGLLLH